MNPTYNYSAAFVEASNNWNLTLLAVEMNVKEKDTLPMTSDLEDLSQPLL